MAMTLPAIALTTQAALVLTATMSAATRSITGAAGTVTVMTVMIHPARLMTAATAATAQIVLPHPRQLTLATIEHNHLRRRLYMRIKINNTWKTRVEISLPGEGADQFIEAHFVAE